MSRVARAELGRQLPDIDDALTRNGAGSLEGALDEAARDLVAAALTERRLQLQRRLEFVSAGSPQALPSARKVQALVDGWAVDPPDGINVQVGKLISRVSVLRMPGHMPKTITFDATSETVGGPDGRAEANRELRVLRQRL